MAKTNFQEIEERKRQQLIERISEIFSISTDEAKQALTQKLLSSVRINPLAGDVESIRTTLMQTAPELEKVLWTDNAYIIREDKDKVTQSELFETGKVYVQNASSFLPVLALDPKPGEVILDICASPGGKSSHIAALTENKAQLWANDLSTSRILKLKRNLETLQVKAANITGYVAQIIDRLMSIQFDKILLDAPCSGEGMMDMYKSEDIKVWSLKRVKRLQNQQKRMIVAAYNLLKSGGRLVYSTCTFGPEENELVVAHLLKNKPTAKVKSVFLGDIKNLRQGIITWRGKELDPQIQNSVRVLPNEYMEGFYLAVIEKPLSKE